MNSEIRELIDSAEFAEERLVASAQSLLQEILLEKGWNQNDLAHAMGVSKGRVSQIFSDNQNFTLRLLAKAFHAVGDAIFIERANRAIEVKLMPTKDDTESSYDQMADILEEFAWTDGEARSHSIQFSELEPLSGGVRRQIARSLRESQKAHVETLDEPQWRRSADDWGSNVFPLIRRSEQ